MKSRRLNFIDYQGKQAIATPPILPPAFHTLSIQGKGASITRLRQYLTKWRQWLRGGLGGLLCRKGGMKRYWVWVKTHLDIRKGAERKKALPTRRWRDGRCWQHCLPTRSVILLRCLRLIIDGLDSVVDGFAFRQWHLISNAYFDVARWVKTMVLLPQ